MLIRGAAGGLGRAIALAFANAGASVSIADVDSDGLEITANIHGTCLLSDGGHSAV